MARTKTREITITEEKGTFNLNIPGIPLFKRQNIKKDYDFEGISALRHLLSNEKARMLHTIKTQNPSSIYDLAKKLGRKFKPVADDIKLLERFGFIELIEEKTKNRIRHKPEIIVDTITINIKV
jgi:predicted transcriptional regulator